MYSVAWCMPPTRDVYSVAWCMPPTRDVYSVAWCMPPTRDVYASYTRCLRSVGLAQEAANDDKAVGWGGGVLSCLRLL